MKRTCVLLANLEGEMANAFLWEEVVHLMVVIVMRLVQMKRDMKKWLMSNWGLLGLLEIAKITGITRITRDYLPVQPGGQQELCKGVEPLRAHRSVSCNHALYILVSIYVQVS